MKKRVLLCIIIMGIITITACARKENQNAEDTKTVSVDNPKKQIKLWSYYETDAQKDSLNELIYLFNTHQDQYQATWEYVPMTEFTKRLSIGIMEGELPDMVIIDNPDMSTYASLGIFEDLSGYKELWKDEDLYYNEVWKSARWEDDYYGFPFTCNNIALFYNTSMLNEKNITCPSTWEELDEAAKELTDEDTYGFAMSCVEGEQAAFQTLPWILSAGESIKSLGETHTQEAFEFLSSMCRNGSLDANCVNWSQNDVARKFISGEAAMMENGPWVIPMLKEAGISYGIVPLPVKKNSVVITGGENISVIKGKDVEGAVEFLQFYSQDDVMKKICKTANVLPPKMEQAKALAEEDADFTVFVDQMHTAVSRVNFDGWSELSKQISEAVYALITGEKDAKAAAESIQN